MSPEMLSAMMKQMGGGTGATPTGATNPQEMMKNPDMLKNAMSMMKNVDPATLASMSQSMGYSLTPEQAAAMKRQMDRLTPDQMATLVSWQQRLARAWGGVKSVYNVLFGSVLRATITVVIVAIIVAGLFQ